MRTALLVLALSVGVSAQAEAPNIDPDLMAAWRQTVALADQIVRDAGLILEKTPEYKAYDAAVKQANSVKAQIKKTAAQKLPGHELDVNKWTWTKVD